MAKTKKQTKTFTQDEFLTQVLVPEAEQPYKVPANWVWTRWGWCGLFTAGNVFSPSLQGLEGLSIPFYKVGSLKYSNNIGYLYDDSNTISEDTRISIKATLIPMNSIIFAKIGEAIRLNRRSLNHTSCCIDNNMIAFSAFKCCFYKYIFYWSCNQEFYVLTNATTVPAIRKSDLAMLSIPLPPLPEQHRIVKYIESLFAKLDRAKELAQNALSSFETRKAAIFHKAFSGKLTAKWRKKNSVKMTSWDEKYFSDVAEIKSNLVDPKDYPDYPHIAPDNIEKRTGMLFEYNTISEDRVTSEKHRFYHGQILYSKIRPYLSKVVIVDFDGLCSADMYPIEAKGDTKYLWYYMFSDNFLEQASSAGSRSLLPKINQKELSKLKIQIPSLHEQQEIVRILDSVFEKEQKARELYDAIEKIDLMKKAILARAFRGELGTNDPNEESALGLLWGVVAK